MFPFQFGPSVNLSVGTSSTSVQLGSPNGGMQARLSTPAGTSDCFIVFGNSTVQATVSAGTHFPTGQCEVVTIPQGTTHVAAICGTGSTTLYVVRSNGG